MPAFMHDGGRPAVSSKTLLEMIKSACLPALLQASSGALGAASGNAIVFPLDLVTTRLQHASPSQNGRKLGIIATLQRIIRRRGMSQLYSGLQADTMSTLLSNFLYFYFYTALHKLATRRHRKIDTSKPVLLTATEELVVGLVAGVASKSITLPISTVVVRQQLESEDMPRSARLSVPAALRKIRAEAGWQGLFAGFGPTLPLALLPSLTMYIHQLLLHALVPRSRQSQPSGIVTFLLGATSNALATVPLYPMVLVKALSQSGSSSSPLVTFEKILYHDGVGGLYKGLEAQLLKGFVNQGVTMLVKQRVEEFCYKAYRMSP